MTVERLRALHHPEPHRFMDDDGCEQVGPDWCLRCGRPWPCDVPALLDVAEAARELLVEAEVIRSHARSLKPHPDTVSDLRAAFDRLDRT